MKKYLFILILGFCPSFLCAGITTSNLTATSTFTVTGSTIVINGTTYYWRAGTGSNGQAMKTDGAAQPTLTFGNVASGSVDTSSFSWVLNPASVRLSTNTPAIDNSSTTYTSRLLYDDTANEWATWATLMNIYHGRGLNAYIVYNATGATSGTVEFNGSVMCVSPLDLAVIDTDQFSVITSSAVKVPGTAGYPSSARWALTDDSCSQGDLIIFRLQVNSAGTAPGDIAVRPSWIYEP